MTTMKTITVHFSVHLPAITKKRDGYFVASCPLLDVVTQGKTESQAKKNLAEALSLFFISCYERGTLDAVLKNCGFKPGYSPSQVEKEPPGYINVPIPFTVNWGNPRQCHA
jgi:predicted RNase H-like HicB family nuclease